jgi:hypothetical protein
VVLSLVEQAVVELTDIMQKELALLKSTVQSINKKTAATNDLDKEYKMLKNNYLTEIGEMMVCLGAYTVHSIMDSMLEQVRRDRDSDPDIWYDWRIRKQMFEKTLTYLGQIKAVVDRLVRQAVGTPINKMYSLASAKFLKLLDIFRDERLVRDKYEGDEATGQPMMNITFVVRKSIARALSAMLQRVAHLGKKMNI